MNHAVAALIFAAIAFQLPAWGAGPEIRLVPERVFPGSVLVVQVTGADAGAGKFMGRAIHFHGTGGAVTAVVGIDLFSAPGTHPMDIDLVSSGKKVTETVQVSILPKAYPTEKLELPPEKVTLTAADLKRVEKEKEILDAIWSAESPEKFWSSSFMVPLKGRGGSVFGLRRIINGEPKSPHTGVDIKANEGEPVRATNSGRVAYAGRQFFSGNSVVLDHGEGFYSMYFHLSKIKVRKGRAVRKGDVIGLVGMTGRASGPHLHFGFRLQGARIDPEAVFGLKSID